MTQSSGLPAMRLLESQYSELVGFIPALVIFMVVFTLIRPTNLDSLRFIGSGPSHAHS